MSEINSVVWCQVSNAMLCGSISATQSVSQSVSPYMIFTTQWTVTDWLLSNQGVFMYWTSFDLQSMSRQELL